MMAIPPICLKQAIYSYVLQALRQGILFYGEEVTYPDNTKEKVEYAVLPYPIFEGGKNIAIQRGSGLIIAKHSTKGRSRCSIFEMVHLPGAEHTLYFVNRIPSGDKPSFY